MYLDAHGQIAFKEVIGPFCKKIDFNETTSLARTFWPLGKNRNVVVDPHHGFGRPTIVGTNIATEAISNLVYAGESKDSVTELFNIQLSAVEDAVEFEMRKIA
jgi:uncharacterized protein (DUF433 family)